MKLTPTWMKQPFVLFLKNRCSKYFDKISRECMILSACKLTKALLRICRTFQKSHSVEDLWKGCSTQKQPLADVFQNRCFLKISQYSQENTCVGVSFLTLLKRNSNTSVFLWISWNFQETYFQEHLQKAASDNVAP